MASTPFFSLATYLASRTSDASGPYLSKLPARPAGLVIWVWATNPDQIANIRGLEAKLAADGDQITFVITLPDAPEDLADDVFQAPMDRAQTDKFLTHWLPGLVLWMRDGLEPAPILEISNRKIPCILIEAARSALTPEHGAWVPGLGRAMMQKFTEILTIDPDTSRALIAGGADPAVVRVIGEMEAGMQALPYFEDERVEFAQILGSRPVWLAADTTIDEVSLLADAHHYASLRSHRLLLIVSLRDEAEGPAVAKKFIEKGFLVALRSADEEPDDSTQVYIADFEGELGLWYRIAPVTYLGLSLSGGPCRSPYEPATLGSAIILGPNIAPFDTQVGSLIASDACAMIRNRNELGNEVERLQSPDVAALMVHGAWEVTSRGADTTARIAEIIMKRIDALGS